MSLLRLGSVLRGSKANGPGLRDVYWTAGCSILCPGCFNPHLHDPNAGVSMEVERLIQNLRPRLGIIEGITVSGGEPTDQAEAVAELACGARQLGLSVVIFSGRYLNECARHPHYHQILPHCDILVAGPFEIQLATYPSKLVASSNQRVHFLTNRYRSRDLEGIPDAEVVITGTSVVITGLSDYKQGTERKSSSFSSAEPLQNDDQQ